MLLDLETVLLVGGNSPYSRAADKLNLTRPAWTRLPDVPHYHNLPACGLVWNVTAGSRHLVVAGSSSRTRLHVSILDIETNEWRRGKTIIDFMSQVFLPAAEPEVWVGLSFNLLQHVWQRPT